MNAIDVANHIGCCGRMCKLCSKADECGGCHEKTAKHAQKNTPDGCFPFYCCRRKGIEGCWQCEQGPCDKDVFSGKQGTCLKGFVNCAKEEGILQLGNYVFQNEILGICYESKTTYMACESEEAVKELLHKAKLVKSFK